MVDVEEIREMKELGVVKRKTEVASWDYEYSFRVPCKFCGEKVEWCFCAENLENVRKVLAARTHACMSCYSKPENMTDYDLDQMKTIMDEAEADGFPLTWDDAFQQLQELWGEMYEGDPHELDDGTEYIDCACPL